MALSDTAIRKAKPADKPQRLFDGGGLYLEIAPSGGQVVATEIPIWGQGEAPVLGNLSGHWIG